MENGNIWIHLNGVFSLLGYTLSVKCPIYFTCLLNGLTLTAVTSEHCVFLSFSQCERWWSLGGAGWSPALPAVRRHLLRFSFVAVEKAGKLVTSCFFPVKERLRVKNISRFLILLIGLGCRATVPATVVRVLEWVPFSLVRRRGLFSYPPSLAGGVRKKRR